MMMLHVPHLSSLHFVTPSFAENSAFVKICFKFFGCLLLTMRSVFLSVDSIFFECRKKFMHCLTIFTICGVLTNRRVCCCCLIFSLDYVAPQSLLLLLSRFHF